MPIDLASSQSLLTRRPNGANPPGLTLTLMTSQHNGNHTGSVKHRVNNYHASYFNSPVGATSQPGESTTSNKSAKTLRIIQIHVEGLSHEKFQYLARLLRENDIDVAVLQETHVQEASSPQRYTIHGYDMTDATYHPKCGTATYVREDLNARSVFVDSHQSNAYVTAIEVSGITVVNIYKPPGVELPTPALPILPHTTVYTGDFNSQSTEWGYRVSDKAGDQLSQWANDNNFHLLMTQSRTVPSIQPAGRKTTRQIFALLRAMMNINPYQRHAPSNHISRTASRDPALSRSAWTYQQSSRCQHLAGISGKQTGLSLRKASLKVSIAYHRGVKTTNASANLLSPRPRNILQEEYENHTSHAGQMKARPYSKSTKRVGIPIHV